MNRREALILIAAGLGETIFGGRRMLAGMTDTAAAGAAGELSSADLVLLGAVADTLLPATADSGGAKAANVAGFIREAVRDFYDPDEQATFLAGLVRLQLECRQRFSGRGYPELIPAERDEVLMSLEGARPQPEYYRMIKQLTILGYFSSEVGATQAMNHVAVPGRFDGIVAIPPGTKAWSD
jgi:hypothetical protein